MDDITYHRHSHHDKYVNATRAFIERQPLENRRHFLDGACGDGAASEIVLEKVPLARLNGIDIDPEQICLALQRFEQRGHAVVEGTVLPPDAEAEQPLLAFATGSVEDLPFAHGSFDCVIIANAIHLVPDKNTFVAAAAKLLKEGGVFGFNSVFYAGTICDGTHEYYTEWLKRAVGHIGALNETRRASGQEPIKRVRGRGRPAFQNVWLGPDDWTEILTRHGLHAHDVHEREMALDAEFFASAGSYSGLAEVLLSGYPVEIAAQALSATAAEAMAALGRTTVPRRWLEVWSSKS